MEEVSNGFGRLLPHQVRALDANGAPTPNLVAIRSLDDLLQHVRPENPILPTQEWPVEAKLPDAQPGNHFVVARFSRAVDPLSVLDPSAQPSGLTGNFTVVAVDPLTGSASAVPGRVFVGGTTTGNLTLQKWVGSQGGRPAALDIDGALPGVGFPGTEGVSAFAGAAQLVDDRAVVFVPDTDGNLATYERFPLGAQVRIRLGTGIRSTSGRPLKEPALAAATVGPDTIAPEVALSPPPFSFPLISPGGGDSDVDPQAPIVIELTEPVQITSVGSLPTGQPPLPSATVNVTFGPPAAVVSVPYSVRPLSVYDLTRLELLPAFDLPGAGPGSSPCGTFNRVDVTVNAGLLSDLSGNVNTLGPATHYFTGEGPGLVNAPVAPDTIYLGRGGATPSVSVLDLNGFGASTGSPMYDILDPIVKGHSNYPNNLNVAFLGPVIIPPLKPGSCTFDGGSAGVFTLTRDSGMDDRLVRAPLIDSVGDMMLGHSLDTTFNNSALTGCKAGGSNLCAATGFKNASLIVTGPNTFGPTLPGLSPIHTLSGTENLISWAPHPNPPPLVFPPTCLSPFIGGQEPSSIDNVILQGLTNQLVPGSSPLGDPSTKKPPQGLLAREQNSYFVGPSPDPGGAGPSACQPYLVRQQIGHFLYVVDRVRSEVVVLNSNWMTVLDRIALPDPTSLAMSSNLTFLAVTNQTADTVSFVDIDPASGTFHQVVKSVAVGRGPTGIAWDPGNEDILVCNEAESSLSVISAASLEVRKTIKNQLFSPFEVAITPRQAGFGFQRNVYFAYVLNRDGSVSLFESGPDGLNGWGFDDVIGQTIFRFEKPKAIRPDYTAMGSAVWIAHERPLGHDGQPTGSIGGALTRLSLDSATIGPLPLGGSPGAAKLRELTFAVKVSIGRDQLTGSPVDIACDNQMNFGAQVNFHTPFSAGNPVSVNGKNLIRNLGQEGQTPPTLNTVEPVYLFAAVPSSDQGGGVVDVIDLATSRRIDTDPFEPGIQSIPAHGVNVVMDYFRQ